ncbi:MAG: hypothetical protein WAL32_13660 [Terriglobales bacterium]
MKLVIAGRFGLPENISVDRHAETTVRPGNPVNTWDAFEEATDKQTVIVYNWKQFS